MWVRAYFCIDTKCEREYNGSRWWNYAYNKEGSYETINQTESICMG